MSHKSSTERHRGHSSASARALSSPTTGGNVLSEGTDVDRVQKEPWQGIVVPR